MNRPRRGRPRGPCRQEAPLWVRTPRCVFLSPERGKTGSADSEEAGVLLGLVVFGAAPAGQVSSQRLLQDPGTCSVGRLPPAPIRSLAASPLPWVVLGSRSRRGNKTLAGPSSPQSPLEVHRSFVAPHPTLLCPWLFFQERNCLSGSRFTLSWSRSAFPPESPCLPLRTLVSHTPALPRPSLSL